MLRDDGYLAPKLTILVILLVFAATVLYLLRASREAAKASSGPDEGKSAHVRRIEQVYRDLDEGTLYPPSRRRTPEGRRPPRTR